MRPTKSVLLFLTILMLGGNALARDTYKQSMHGDKAAKAIPHTTVTFEPGSAMLTEADKNDLRKLVQDAKAKGTINQLTVAAWSDKALPARGEKLTEEDRDLADKRANAVSDFLKTNMEISGIDIDKYNMAENSNWLARTFNTKDAELKSVFSKRGGEIPVNNAEFQVIKNKGGPREAVIVTEMTTP